MPKGVTAELQLRQALFEQRAIIEMINQVREGSLVYARLVERLFNAIGVDVSALNKTEINQFVRSATQALQTRLDKDHANIDKELQDFAVVSYNGADNTFKNAGFVVAAVSIDRVRAAARNSFVQGHPLTDNLKATGRNLVNRVNGHIRDGWVQGRTNAQILRDIRGVKGFQKVGTRKRKVVYRLPGSDVGVYRSQLESVVRTGANTYAQDARALFAKANDDLIALVRWVSVLDNRTTFICMSRDGKMWPAGSNHPTPPAHWNCRSTLIYLTDADEADAFFTRASRVPKSQRAFDELTEFRQTDSKARSKIARTEGKQVTVSSFEQFLRQLPKTASATTYLNDLFGSRVAVDAFRRGDFTLEDLVVNGKPLTKTELRAKLMRKQPKPFPRSEL